MYIFEKVNKITKPLANLTKTRREKIQINKTSDKNGTSQKTPMKSRE
jgi:hypothetical protein